MSKYLPISASHFQGHQYDDDSLCDVRGTLEITLVDEQDEKLILRFDDYLAYRKLDEGDALRTLLDIAVQMKCGLHLVEDSHFLEWFEDESWKIRTREKGLKHFCLITLNSVIDVIAFSEPQIHKP